jgi:pSer/pThr/pTyr-binding forkhead associated (FHA) protein
LQRRHVHGPLGPVSVDDDQSIIIEIDGMQLPLPIAPSLVLGRLSSSPDPSDQTPHVDLSAFSAAQKGVSRQHARISRKYGLIYIADLGSTNGTLLNSLLLTPHSDRVIRSGDEVRLGDLTLRIILPPSS